MKAKLLADVYELSDTGERTSTILVPAGTTVELTDKVDGDYIAFTEDDMICFSVDPKKVAVITGTYAVCNETVSDPNTGEVIVLKGRRYEEVEFVDLTNALSNLGIEPSEVLEMADEA